MRIYGSQQIGNQKESGNAVTFSGFLRKTPLQQMMRAIQKNDRATVQKLLDQGVRLDQFEGALSPLLQAVYSKHPEMVQFLLDKGANPEAGNRAGQSVLTLMLSDTLCHQDPVQYQMIDMLLPRSNLRRRDAEGHTTLNLAVKNGYYKVAEKLLTLGVDPTIASLSDDMTPLMYAAWSGKLDLVMKIVDAVPSEKREAYLEAKNKYSRTALDIAKSQNRKEIIVFLASLQPQ